MSLPRVADLHAGEWQEHARFPGIYMKGLLTSADNPLASANVVQVPSGGVIGRHLHAKQVETVWIIKGEAILTLGEAELNLKDGQIVAIPIGLEHALRNEGNTSLELLTFFTPPLN
jgi:mannose-6-phosphate isomerase-like protein (cupin superfamily)